MARGRFKVNNGHQTRFWKDLWLGNESLVNRYPMLYRIVRRKNTIVSRVLSTSPLNVSFRRALIGEKLVAWLELVALVVLVSLNENEDVFVWNLNKHGSFSFQSFYKDIMKRERTPEKTSFGGLNYL